MLLFFKSGYYRSRRRNRQDLGETGLPGEAFGKKPGCHTNMSLEITDDFEMESVLVSEESESPEAVQSAAIEALSKNAEQYKQILQNELNATNELIRNAKSIEEIQLYMAQKQDILERLSKETRALRDRLCGLPDLPAGL